MNSLTSTLTQKKQKNRQTAKVTMKHFEDALRKVRTQKDLKTSEKISLALYMISEKTFDTKLSDF